MELTKLVEDGAVVASLNASERGPVVRELLESLAAAGRIDDSSVDPLHNAVMKRERKGSTGFGHGVAVPHAKSTMVDNIRIASARMVSSSMLLIVNRCSSSFFC